MADKVKLASNTPKRLLRCTLAADDKTKIKIYDDTVCKCETHKVSAKWGDMSPIAQLALKEGIDTDPELTCLLLA